MIVRVLSFYKKEPKCLPVWLYHFAFPTAVCGSACCSVSWPVLVPSVFWILPVLIEL